LNKPEVYRSLQGPPNNWTKQQIGRPRDQGRPDPLGEGQAVHAKALPARGREGRAVQQAPDALTGPARQKEGELLAGSLPSGRLVRLRIADNHVIEERYLGNLGARIRDVREGPDGVIYLLTDTTRGRILRLEPPG
jgi:hypothetical protein